MKFLMMVSYEKRQRSHQDVLVCDLFNNFQSERNHVDQRAVSKILKKLLNEVQPLSLDNNIS